MSDHTDCFFVGDSDSLLVEQLATLTEDSVEELSCRTDKSLRDQIGREFADWINEKTIVLAGIRQRVSNWLRGDSAPGKFMLIFVAVDDIIGRTSDEEAIPKRHFRWIFQIFRSNDPEGKGLVVAIKRQLNDEWRQALRAMGADVVLDRSEIMDTKRMPEIKSTLDLAGRAYLSGWKRAIRARHVWWMQFLLDIIAIGILIPSLAATISILVAQWLSP